MPAKKSASTEGKTQQDPQDPGVPNQQDANPPRPPVDPSWGDNTPAVVAWHRAFTPDDVKACRHDVNFPDDMQKEIEDRIAEYQETLL